jgi:hypothetical protein
MLVDTPGKVSTDYDIEAVFGKCDAHEPVAKKVLFHRNGISMMVA